MRLGFQVHWLISLSLKTRKTIVKDNKQIRRKSSQQLNLIIVKKLYTNDFIERMKTYQIRI